jgi:hypothetical protein
MAMTKCKECNHEISDQATSCPSCGAPQKPKSKGLGLGAWIFIIVGVVAVYQVATINSGSTGSAPASAPSKAGISPPPVAQSTGPLLEVQSWRCDHEHGYVFVRGEVKNISSNPLKNVVAVGHFRTKSGDLVKSETALLEYNPILAGQTSPFRAGGTGNPQIANCGLSFAYLMGGSVEYTERQRKKDK